MNTFFLEKIKHYYLNNPNASSPAELWFVLCQNFPAPRPLPYSLFIRKYADQQIISQFVGYQGSNIESDRHAYIIKIVKNALANKTLNPKGLFAEMMQLFFTIYPNYFTTLNNQGIPYLIEPSIQEARSIYQLICKQSNNLAPHELYINNNMTDLLLNLNIAEKIQLLDIQYQIILRQTEIDNKPYENFIYYLGELPKKQVVIYIRKMFDYLPTLNNAAKITTLNLIIKYLPLSHKELKEVIYQKLLNVVDVNINEEAWIIAKVINDNLHDLKLTGKFWQTLKQKMIAILQNRHQGRSALLICNFIGKITPRLQAVTFKKLLLKILTDRLIANDRKIILIGEVVFFIPNNFNQVYFDKIFETEINNLFEYTNSSVDSFYSYDFSNDMDLTSVIDTGLTWPKARIISLNKISAIVTEKVRIAWIRKQIKKAQEGMVATETGDLPRVALSAIGSFNQIIPPSYRLKVIDRLTGLLDSVNRPNITVALQTLNEIYAQELFLELATSDQLMKFVDVMLDELNLSFFKLKSLEFIKKFAKTISFCGDVLKERVFVFFMQQGLAKPDKDIIQEAFAILKTISIARREKFLAEVFTTLLAEPPQVSTFFGLLWALPKLVTECFCEDYLYLVKNLVIMGYETFINELLTTKVALQPASSSQVIAVDVINRMKIIAESTDSIPLAFQQPIIEFLIHQIFENNNDASYYAVLALSKLVKKIPVASQQLIIDRVKTMGGTDFKENCAFPLLTNLALAMDDAAKVGQIIYYLDILVKQRVHNESIQKNIIILLKNLPEPQINYFIYAYIPDLIAKSKDSLLRLELMVLINMVNKSRSKNLYVSSKLENISELAGIVFDYANEDQIVRLSR